MKTRGRDIFRTLAMVAPVFVALWISGALSLSAAAAGIFASLCLATVYYFTIGDEPEYVPSPTPSDETTEKKTGTAWEMLEHMPDPVLWIAPGGRIQHANTAARAFLSLSPGALNIAAVLRQPEALEAVEAALRGETPAPVEYRAVVPYDRWVKAFASPLPDAGGAIMTLHDETDLRRTERMRADFLANASHELRTPLASLSGFIETLRGHARDDADARERFLAVMQGQAERMRRLIDDLLSLSRIEMNEHLPPAGAVDLLTIANDVATALKPIAAAKSVEIAIADAAPAIVIGDRDQLTAATQNLIDNALKYSPRGGVVQVEILTGVRATDAMLPERRDGAARFSIVALEPGRAMAALRVIDQGPGIEASHLPRLSQRFYRVEEGKSEDRKGTGLGLAIVKHIIARHRGGLVVDSRPGHGASFTLSAPLAETPASPRMEPVAAQAD